MQNKNIRVLLVDDHDIVREGVRYVLSNIEDIEVAAEASNSAEAMQLLQTHRIDVAVIDIALPETSGLVLLHLVKAEHPTVRTLVLSSYSETEYGVQVVREGGDGYVMKASASTVLPVAIRAVAAGGKYLSERILAKLGEDIAWRGSRPDRELFSFREKQILLMLAQGKGLTEIGEELHLSIKTISTYRARVLEKTGLKNNAELVRFALERGLLS